MVDFKKITTENNVFEESELYSYFADNEFLCIICREPDNKNHKLIDNTFIGFKRLVFSEDFIDSAVRKIWVDTRHKIINHTLEDRINYSHGKPIILKSDGSVSTAPNFMKSKDNAVFIRGSGGDSSKRKKTVEVNGIKMIPQYYWIKGTSMVKELETIPML